ncbi:MAG: polyribonucleotide nucleotidyltransferase, partial [Candidatus Yonathbacteria bacterium RIFCSPHIGHO2_01_FULL_51_10]
RRETKPSDEAILAGRIVDRTIRPLFPQHIRHDVQVILTVLSLGQDDPDVLAVNAASIALATSDIPWSGPVSSVRIGKHIGNDDLVVNPDYAFRTHTDFEFEIIACGKDGSINMIEAEGKEVPEDLMVKALSRASEEIEKIQAFQKELVAAMGVEKRAITKKELGDEAKRIFTRGIAPELDQVVFYGAGNTKINELKDRWMMLFNDAFDEDDAELAEEHFEYAVNEILHTEAIERDRRADGRAFDEVRALYAQAGGLSNILHGSGIFYRGQTHVLSVVTLGGPRDCQILDGMETRGKKRFLHHYNFPPYSSGETGRININRRSVGHGALAEKALAQVLPPQETFPYTIRVVSESMSSNGSTSMASVCAGTLALMDAGVPIKAPVAGIAMGLMSAHGGSASGRMEDRPYKILTDIQGPEDHHGDMDFKVAGTANGITAIQLDIKVDGVPLSVLAEALTAAKKARLQILDTITQAIPAPRPDVAPSAPKIIVLKIGKDQIGLVIGPGGKTINKVKEETGAQIDIEEDGTVFLTGINGSAERARDILIAMTHLCTVGERHEGSITKIFDFGVLVRLTPSSEGLVHISEIAPFRIDAIGTNLHEGDIVPVIVKEIDRERDRIGLSIKMADPTFAEKKGFVKEHTNGTLDKQPNDPA